jgi:hypothetical protein
MSLPLTRGGACSRDDLSNRSPLPARHCTPHHLASPSHGVDGVPAGPAADSLLQPPSRLPASSLAGVDGRSARQGGTAQLRQLSTRHHATPHTGVESRSARSEQLQQPLTHHTATPLSTPCYNGSTAATIPASSNTGVEGGSTWTAGPAADFIALYDRCMVKGLKACLTFNH